VVTGLGTDAGGDLVRVQEMPVPGTTEPEVPEYRRFPGGRIRPPYVAGEKAMYDGWIDFHRQTLLWKCDGLTDDQLKQRSVAPSGLSLLGLIRHMHEVELGWFGDFADSPYEFVYGEDDFDGVDAADARLDLARFRSLAGTVHELLAGIDLEMVITTESGREIGLRWVYAHILEEYARHNGHADLLREAIDGATGD